MYSAFYNFKTQAELHFNCKLKSLRIDWGGEFRSLTSPFPIFGVIHQLSCPHTLEQNGVVERNHRDTIEKGLTLLAQANLPIQY